MWKLNYYSTNKMPKASRDEGVSEFFGYFQKFSRYQNSYLNGHRYFQNKIS